MNPSQKALWYIESHLDGALSLDDIAAIGGVSRYHMVRAFAAATGLSVMRYVRARRLSRAAKALSEGAPDILAVALDAGYGSHEAFTRAFREQFGLTPDAARDRGRIAQLPLVEALRMDTTLAGELGSPRFETHRPLLVAGLSERYHCERTAGIPGQWQRLQPHFGAIPGEVPGVAYGVCCNADDAGNFDYLCGVEVADFSELPADFARLRIVGARYAVFTHRDHVSTIQRTVATIWNHWLPGSGRRAADGPTFERYDAAFDPRTGHGGFEIWIPIEA